MHNLQIGWMSLLEDAESKYVVIANAHNEFMAAVGDTTQHWRQLAIQQDSSLAVRIQRLGDQFGRASRRHLFQLKELRSFLEANEVWLMRVETEGAPRRAIRGSWEARSTQFKTKFEHIQNSLLEFDGFAEDYAELKRRIPGMEPTAADGLPTPTALPQSPGAGNANPLPAQKPGQAPGVLPTPAKPLLPAAGNGH